MSGQSKKMKKLKKLHNWLDKKGIPGLCNIEIVFSWIL